MSAEAEESKTCGAGEAAPNDATLASVHGGGTRHSASVELRLACRSRVLVDVDGRAMRKHVLVCREEALRPRPP